MNFKLFLEEFDTVSDFLLNPKHRHKSYDQLLDEFKKSGGEILGYGTFTTVYKHPNWKYVVKVFPQNECYLKFARFAYRHHHKSLPIFYGPPQRVIPFYTRHYNASKLYLVRTEMLYPVTDQVMLNDIINALAPIDAESIRQAGFENNPEYRNYFNLFKKYPQTESLFSALKLVNDGVHGCALDFARDNIMQRKDGTLVLNDPLWPGSNPYADYAKQMDMETDRYGNEEYEKEQPTVVGGKLPKKIRLKSPKPIKPSPLKPGEIPF